MLPLKWLYLFIFLLSLGMGTANPVVPIFARDLGATYTQIGLLGTAFGLASLVFAVPLGLLSDRVGRKTLLVGGGLLVVLAAPGYWLATTIGQLVGLRFLEGLSLASLLTSAEALATELAGARTVGTAMGWMSAAYNAGFAGGAFLGGSVADRLGVKAAFGIYLAAALAGVGAARGLRNPKPIPSQLAEPDAALRSLNDSWRKGEVLLGYLTGAIYILDLGIMVTFLPVYARSLGLSIAATGLLFAVFWLARMVVSLAAGMLSDNVGRYPVLAGALLTCGVGFAMVAIGRVAWLMPAVVVTGLGLGACFPASIALVSDHVPRARRGLAMGVFETAGGIALMVGTAAGGLLADRFHPRAPYLLAFALSIMAVAVLLIAARFTSTGASAQVPAKTCAAGPGQ